MYGREELNVYWGSAECVPDRVYEKEDADKVMDAMEARIKELEEDLVEARGVNAGLRLYIKGLEEDNKHLDDMVDAYQKSEALDIAKLDEKDKRIKELEAEVEMDAKKRRIMIDGYNRKCERVKELEEQCTKYQAELMNNDPALNYMPPTTEDSSVTEKEK